MGIFEKRKYRNLLIYINDYDAANPATFKKFDPKVSTCQQLYDHFGVDKNTQDFTGHAVALYRDDRYAYIFASHYLWNLVADTPLKVPLMSIVDPLSCRFKLRYGLFSFSQR